MAASFRHEKYAKQIGNALTAQRMNKNLTQGQLATQLGVEQETISRFERGATLPPLSRLLDLVEIFDISMHEFICQCAVSPADHTAALALKLSALSEDDRSWVYGWVIDICARLAVPD
ncbi:helix-turn-helix domain-containing protein [Duganella guangzhouensis]|nr:helix-turn-helix transcriptional regulator [Duganella guangzhouensis]